MGALLLFFFFERRWLGEQQVNVRLQVDGIDGTRVVTSVGFAVASYQELLKVPVNVANALRVVEQTARELREGEAAGVLKIRVDGYLISTVHVNLLEDLRKHWGESTSRSDVADAVHDFIGSFPRFLLPELITRIAEDDQILPGVVRCELVDLCVRRNGETSVGRYVVDQHHLALVAI